MQDEDPDGLDTSRNQRWPRAQRLWFLLLAAVACWIAFIGAAFIAWRMLTS